MERLDRSVREGQMSIPQRAPEILKLLLLAGRIGILTPDKRHRLLHELLKRLVLLRIAGRRLRSQRLNLLSQRGKLCVQLRKFLLCPGKLCLHGRKLSRCGILLLLKIPALFFEILLLIPEMFQMFRRASFGIFRVPCLSPEHGKLGVQG